MITDLLNTRVTSAIWRAEQLEEQGAASFPVAWAEVSALEEALAKEVPVSEPEGRIARRGAVRAALKAQDFARAEALAERYLAEKDTPPTLRAALLQLFKGEDRWDRTFARSQDKLAKMAAKAREDIRDGKVRDVGIDEL